VRPEGLSMRNSIGNRTRDLAASSAMPQPPAPPRAPYIYIYIYIERERERERERVGIRTRILTKQSKVRFPAEVIRTDWL